MTRNRHRLMASQPKTFTFGGFTVPIGTPFCKGCNVPVGPGYDLCKCPPLPRARDAKDFAIEFGEYLAKETDAFLEFFNRACVLRNSDHIHELSDRLRGIQSRIYEFRKRAQKAAL